MRELMDTETCHAEKLVRPLQPKLALATNRLRMLNALNCLPVDRPPVWLMRQAGRCLPEYRALKESFSFRQLIQIPDLATEVTLQPIRRFGFDAAIIFSDILVIPEALGQGFRFRDTGGVEMDFTVRDSSDVKKLNSNAVAERLGYVAEAIRMTRKELGSKTALLGFAGSPWTLANFMLEGGSSGDHSKALEMFRNNRPLFDALCEELTLSVIEFLQLQINSGVDAIQIFDSLGGLLPTEEFEQASGHWIRTIVTALNGQVPVIVYSKGTRDWKSLIATRSHAIGIDHEIEMSEARQEIPSHVAIQGNLPPAFLDSGEPEMVATETNRLLELMRHRDGYIFNLGHGVPPHTRLENLDALVQTVQNFV